MTASAPDRRRIALGNGVLDIAVARADWPLDDLCAFAERNNPKRGFLIVSKVLGRHLPTRPGVMRASAAALAARIAGDLPGPILVMGLAETAICLGQTVAQELARGRGDVCYLHSTRMVIDGEVLARFEEPHSHASAHLVYRPGWALDDVRSLVIVDDEVSTGRTVANLRAAIAPHLPGLERTVAAALTDWSGDGAANVVSLLAGALTWTPGAAVTASPAFEAGAPALGRLDQRRDFGRLGGWPELDFDSVITALDLSEGSRLRVLGTGEFTYAPFRLAEALETAGHDVVMQSTTRSPAKLGGAMISMLRFEDGYDTGVPNFLYNVDPGDGRLTLIAHETAAGSVDAALVRALGARTLDLAAHPRSLRESPLPLAGGEQ